jgi:hypothetical protein
MKPFLILMSSCRLQVGYRMRRAITDHTRKLASGSNKTEAHPWQGT